MIKNIIFDIGNVLISYKPEEYIQQFDFTEEVKEKVFHTIFQSRYWKELDRGTITENEAVESFCKGAPEIENEIRQVMKHWMDMLYPLSDTIKILKMLKCTGCKVFLLSNYHKAAFQKITNENEFIAAMDGMIISNEVKLIKPEKGIYEMLLKKYDLKPEECLYTDDMQVNLDGAEELGIHTYLFQCPENFMKYLQDNQIL